MAQSGNRPPRRGQSAKTGSGPPAGGAGGTGNGRATAGAGRDSAAERARERLAQRNLGGQKNQTAAQRARTAPPAKPRSKAEAAAAQRARAGGPAQRRRPQGRSKATLAAVFGSVVVLVVVLVIVLVSVTGNKAPTKPTGFGLKAAPASVVSAISSVPLSSFNAAGSTATSSGPYPGAITPLSGQPALKQGGKPLVIYVGSNWCPYCAASRWPLAVALSRFGTFKNLKITKSGAATGEPYPKTNTLSFHDSSYSSPYFSFLAVEQCSDLVAPAADDSKTAVEGCNGYEPLENLTGVAEKSFLKYDFPPTQSSANEGGIPYINFGNKWVEDGAFMDPAALGGYDWNQIAVSISNPVASPGQPILVGANYYSALICQLTKGKPGSVCDSTAVKGAAAAMKL